MSDETMSGALLSKMFDIVERQAITEMRLNKLGLDFDNRLPRVEHDLAVRQAEAANKEKDDELAKLRARIAELEKPPTELQPAPAEATTEDAPKGKAE